MEQQRRHLRLAIVSVVLVGAALTMSQIPATAANACGASSDLLGTQADNCGTYVQVASGESSPSRPAPLRDTRNPPTGPSNPADNTDPFGGHGDPFGHCIVYHDETVDPSCARPVGTGTAAPASDATPAVTISDIASFRPDPGSDHMQPDGWTVAGLDTNFYALAAQQVVPGRLLGRAAEVRFTPVAYRWDYGDGSSAVLGSAGGTWQQLRVAEFDPTPTSHVYRTLGDVTIRLRIDYRAEYRFDGPSFIPIAGTITLPANDLRITVGDAKTVLVDRDCSVDPGGPGC